MVISLFHIVTSPRYAVDFLLAYSHTHTDGIYFLNFVPVTLRNFSLQKPGWLVSNDILSNCVIRLSKSMHNARQRMHNQRIKTTKVDMARLPV